MSRQTATGRPHNQYQVSTHTHALKILTCAHPGVRSSTGAGTVVLCLLLQFAAYAMLPQCYAYGVCPPPLPAAWTPFTSEPGRDLPTAGDESDDSDRAPVGLGGKGGVTGVTPLSVFAGVPLIVPFGFETPRSLHQVSLPGFVTLPQS